MILYFLLYPLWCTKTKWLYIYKEISEMFVSLFACYILKLKVYRSTMTCICENVVSLLRRFEACDFGTHHRLSLLGFTSLDFWMHNVQLNLVFPSHMERYLEIHSISSMISQGKPIINTNNQVTMWLQITICTWFVKLFMHLHPL